MTGATGYNSVFTSLTSIGSGSIYNTGSAIIIGTTTDNSNGIIQSQGNIVPVTNNSYSIGTSAYQWNQLFIGGTANISGTTNISSTTPELRFTTADNNYSRLQRNISNMSLYLKSISTSVGGTDNAIKLNAATTIISTPDTGLPSGSNPIFSICFWWNATSTGNGNSLNYGNGQVYIQASNGSSFMALYVNGTLVGQANTNSRGVWYHFGITYDGTSIRYYLNGVNIFTSVTSFTITPGTNLTFAGQCAPIMSQFVFYNVQLSTAQIQSIYNVGNGIASSNLPITGLIRLYSMNEGSGSVLNDTNPNGTRYNANITNAFTWQGVGNGKVPTIGTASETTILQYQNGTYANETGTLYVGDISSGTWLQGLSVKTLINNSIIPFIIGTTGKVYISSANVLATSVSLTDLGVVGGVAIGTYVTTNAAPANGLLISGTTLMGTPTSNGAGILQTAGNIVPSATNTYSLGSVTYQWLQLAIGGTATIVGSVGIGTTASFPIIIS